MINQAIQQSEVQGVAIDDQHLAELRDSIRSTTRRRESINADLRRLRRMENEIIQRRVLTDTTLTD